MGSDLTEVQLNCACEYYAEFFTLSHVDTLLSLLHTSPDHLKDLCPYIKLKIEMRHVDVPLL